ncbi:MAG: family 78 glycoside hydrolase catalytic domain [Suipraeoptans sp.]
MQIRFLTEYMDNPIGIDTNHPLFSWYIEEDLSNNIQLKKKHISVKAYQINVGESEADVCEGVGKIWNSGIVKTGELFSVSYQGVKLKSACKYYVSVTLYLEDNKQYKSDVFSFVTGFIDHEKWDATWIYGPSPEKAAFWFRKEFNVEQKITSAICFVASPCYNICSVNGMTVDDSVLNNAWTNTNKSVLYRTYEITNLVQKGKNIIGLVLGNGWHNIRKGEDGIGWGDYPFSLKIMLKFQNQNCIWINSDLDNWYYHTEGPIEFNSIYHGEIYNANKILTGWNKIGYNMDHNWKPVVEHEPMKGIIKSQVMEPIRVIKHIMPIRIYENVDGSLTYDFGQNFAGWTKLTINGKRDTLITLKYAELKHKSGSVNQISLRRARATDEYILKGNCEEVFEPHFTYHGFRYVQVFGIEKNTTAFSLIGCQVRSDVARIGDFFCDNKLINQLYRNIIWTEESNLHGIPTDCPQRDERLGWLNDMTVRNEGALYNYRLIQMYDKWMNDICNEQGEVTGAITDTAPYHRYGLRTADPVCSSFLLIPWNIYRFYGDCSIIKKYYEPMKRWVEYLRRNTDDYIVRYSQMGDWAAPLMGNDIQSLGSGSVSVITPTVLIGTCFFYYDCELLSKMAGVIGNEEDQALYLELAKKVKKAFNNKFFNQSKKCYGLNSQASNALPLYLGMVPTNYKNDVLNNLIADIHSHNCHLSTGNLCTRYAMEILFQNGQQDLAFELLTKTDYPSWGYMIANGATTMWERWEKVEEESQISRMASHSHPMTGAFGICFQKYLLGISPDENNPGFENVLIHPVIPTEMKSAQGKLITTKGTVISQWEKDNEILKLNVHIPQGCTGTIDIPIGKNCKRYKVEDGWHTFIVDKDSVK